MTVDVREETRLSDIFAAGIYIQECIKDTVKITTNFRYIHLKTYCPIRYKMYVHHAKTI